MRSAIACVVVMMGASVFAADLSKVDRTLAKEPKYAGAPRYCLLVFGAEANCRVWLVLDGGTLYVDRTGNGDLTLAGDRVAANKPQPGDPEGEFTFDVGELRVGGKTHKGLKVLVAPLKALADNPNPSALPQVGAALKKGPNAVTARLEIDVECKSIRGGGVGGRVSYLVTHVDGEGVLQLATTALDAPIIHFDGPLQVTLYGKPSWRAGRSAETFLCVGTPGSRPGAFAMLKYEGTIPPDQHPKIDVTFVSNNPAQKTVQELFELKERC